MDTLKLIKAKRNTKAAAKTPVPVAQDVREHLAQAREKPQKGGRHVLRTLVPQDDG